MSSQAMAHMVSPAMTAVFGLSGTQRGDLKQSAEALRAVIGTLRAEYDLP